MDNFVENEIKKISFLSLFFGILFFMVILNFKKNFEHVEHLKFDLYLMKFQFTKKIASSLSCT